MEGEGRGAPGTSSENAAEAPGTAVSCTKYFDALWFCYSPVHQLKRYYVHGDVDDCVSHWGALMACLQQKTRFRLADDDEALPVQPCLWTTRSPAEAGEFWSQEFPADSDLKNEREGSINGDGKNPPMA